MSIDESPFCRVYLDHRGPAETIEQAVGKLMGLDDPLGHFVDDELDVCVVNDGDWTPIEARDYSNWINWKFHLEVFPARDGVNEAEFAIPVKVLLQKLQSVGIQAVPSCNFEELLSPFNKLSDEAAV
jgi:hypothetical protein